MHTLDTEIRIPSSPAAVWAYLGDLDNQAIGEGVADRIVIDRRADKPIRTMHLTAALGGGSVSERIDDLDDVAMRMAYEIIDFGPMPMTHYSGVLQCHPDGAGTRLTYVAQFDGPDPAFLQGIAAGNFQALAANLARLAAA
jgi:hypothetical protein